MKEEQSMNKEKSSMNANNERGEYLALVDILLSEGIDETGELPIGIDAEAFAWLNAEMDDIDAVTDISDAVEMMGL
jgi:hypothetical protein